MAYVTTPLTDAVRETADREWGIPVAGDGVRLTGGEESASYRLGDHVVRVGPTWRGTAELEWAYEIAARAAVDVPEVTAPVANRYGGYVVRVDDRPISVWPYADGSWADQSNESQREQAAHLLARLHRAFAAMSDVTERPDCDGLARQRKPHPAVADPTLDDWFADFKRRRTARQPIHGDVYRANVLVRGGRIVALLDWDDVSLGPPEQEVAWAAAEWSDTRQTVDLAPVMWFVDTYLAAGGTACRLDTVELAQLIRHRIRMDVNYSYSTGQWGASDDPEELEYEANQLRAFKELSPTGRIGR